MLPGFHIYPFSILPRLLARSSRFFRFSSLSLLVASRTLHPVHKLVTRAHIYDSCAYDIGPGPAKQAATRSVLQLELYDVNAIFESPFHLCPFVPERNFRILPQEVYPWAENRPTMCRPTRVASSRTSSAHSDSYAPSENRWTGTGKAREARLEMFKNKVWILLIPESEAGACVRV